MEKKRVILICYAFTAVLLCREKPLSTGLNMYSCCMVGGRICELEAVLCRYVMHISFLPSAHHPVLCCVSCTSYRNSTGEHFRLLFEFDEYTEAAHTLLFGAGIGRICSPSGTPLHTRKVSSCRCSGSLKGMNISGEESE